MTVEVKDPPINIMLRNGPIDQLTEFARKLGENNKSSSSSTSQGASQKPLASTPTQSQNGQTSKLPVLKQSLPAQEAKPSLKRLRDNLDISKPEAMSIRKQLKVTMSGSTNNVLCLNGGGNSSCRPLKRNISTAKDSIVAATFVSNEKLIFSKTLNLQIFETANVTHLDLSDRKLSCVSQVRYTFLAS